MILSKLENYYNLAEEIEQLSSHILEIQHYVEAAQSPILDGQPKSPNHHIREQQIAEMMDLKNILDEKMLLLIKERKEVEKHIDAITDSMKRQIMRKRFIEGKAWFDVADEVGYSEYHVRRLTKELRNT